LDNMITGNAGANILTGGAGDDILIGGGGADMLYGSAGSDIFRFLALTDSTGSHADVIADFVQGEDHIDVSALGFTGLDNSMTPSAGHLGTYIDQGVTHLTDGHDFDVIIQAALTLTNADIIHA